MSSHERFDFRLGFVFVFAEEGEARALPLGFFAIVAEPFCGRDTVGRPLDVPTDGGESGLLWFARLLGRETKGGGAFVGVGTSYGALTFPASREERRGDLIGPTPPEVTEVCWFCSQPWSGTDVPQISSSQS